MTAYRVTISHTMHQTFYLLADSIEAAREDADAFADFDRYGCYEHDAPEVDVDAAMTEPPKGARVWTGGPEGGWA